jgi:hypothetical protein
MTESRKLTNLLSKGDAYDVKNFLEYEDVVKKVLEKRPTRAIIVFVDMKDIKCAVKNPKTQIMKVMMVGNLM